MAALLSLSLAPSLLERDSLRREPCHDKREVRGHLGAYFWNNTVGPGLWKWSHYFNVYEEHLARIQCSARPSRILEPAECEPAGAPAPRWLGFSWPFLGFADSRPLGPRLGFDRWRVLEWRLFNERYASASR